MEGQETTKRTAIAVVEELYDALGRGDRGGVSRLVVSDLEWWFHGPPQQHHMMRMLTGEVGHCEFRYEPRSVEMAGECCVIAEGWEGAQVYWVHVWTLKKGGDDVMMISQLREYFNTWVTVQDLEPEQEPAANRRRRKTVWQSSPMDLARRSYPALLLALQH